MAAASGGNHGAAVAYAASVLGIKARIFVPTISSPAKLARIAGYGASHRAAKAPTIRRPWRFAGLMSMKAVPKLFTPMTWTQHLQAREPWAANLRNRRLAWTGFLWP